MEVFCNKVQRSISIDTDKKTVHRNDVDNLARSIKAVLQSSSKIVVNLENKKLYADQQITNMSSDTIRNELLGKYEEVVCLEEKMARSSYKHADFKLDKLESLANKIESAINSLKHAKDSCVEKNPFLAELLEVRNQGITRSLDPDPNVMGFKLDLNASGEFGRVPYKQ